MKEGWKDGHRGGLNNKGWALDEQRERRDAAEEWMKRGVYIYRGPCGPGWSMGAGAIFLSSFFTSPSPPLLKIAFLRGSAPLLLSSVSPHSLFSPTISPADRGCGGRDGRCPLRVRQHFLSVPEARSGGIRGRPELAPLSVCEVHLLCSVTPRTTPISAALGLCKLELTTPPRPFKICTAAMPQRLTSFQLCGGRVKIET